MPEAGGPGTPTTPKNPNGHSGETPQALKAWWANFKKKPKKDQATGTLTPLAAAARCVPLTQLAAAAAQPPPGIFGIPLDVSIKYAHVAISLMDERGASFVYGYVPIVVAKCGVFLKEKGTLSLVTPARCVTLQQPR